MPNNNLVKNIINGPNNGNVSSYDSQTSHPYGDATGIPVGIPPIEEQESKNYPTSVGESVSAHAQGKENLEEMKLDHDGENIVKKHFTAN